MFTSKIIIYLLYFCVYSVLLLVVGKSRLQENDTLRHFYIGGRKLNLLSSTLTFVGTWISAATILGFTGNVFESGYAPLMYSVIPWMCGALLLYFISDRLYAHDVLTIPELFAKRYQSKWLQVVLGAVIILVYVLYLVIQIKGFGLVVANLFDIPYLAGALMIYLFILYATFGGYRSVTRTDSFNIVALTIGLIIIFAVVVGAAGGPREIYRQVGQIGTVAHSGVGYANQPGDLFHLFGKNNFTPLMSISMFFGWGLGLAANPQYTIRLISARNSKTARRTVLASLAYLLIFYAALLLIGLGMRVLFPTLAAVNSADDVFVYVINNLLYSPLSGFFLFAIIGACVSTANSQLLLIATSFAYDIVNNVSTKPIPEYRLLTLSRLGIIIGGTCSLLLSLRPPDNLLSYGGDIWGILGVMLFPSFYGTLLYRKSTRQGVWACFIVGALAIMIFYPIYYAGILPVHPAFPATLLSFGGYWLGCRFTWKEGEPDAD